MRRWSLMLNDDPDYLWICSCGEKYKTLDELNTHAIAHGGLLHGDFEETRDAEIPQETGRD
jgi:hypothetical protein